VKTSWGPSSFETDIKIFCCDEFANFLRMERNQL
jgi:hypothetical protein